MARETAVKGFVDLEAWVSWRRARLEALGNLVGILMEVSAMCWNKAR